MKLQTLFGLLAFSLLLTSSSFGDEKIADTGEFKWKEIRLCGDHWAPESRTKLYRIGFYATQPVGQQAKDAALAAFGISNAVALPAAITAFNAATTTGPGALAAAYAAYTATFWTTFSSGIAGTAAATAGLSSYKLQVDEDSLSWDHHGAESSDEEVSNPIQLLSDFVKQEALNFGTSIDQKVTQPVVDATIVAGDQFEQNVTQPIVDATIKAGDQFEQNVTQPVVDATIKAGDQFEQNVTQPVVGGVEKVGDKVADFFGW